MIKSYLLVFILVTYFYVANYPNLVSESNKHFIMLDFVGQKFKQGQTASMAYFYSTMSEASAMKIQVV